MKGPNAFEIVGAAVRDGRLTVWEANFVASLQRQATRPRWRPSPRQDSMIHRLCATLAEAEVALIDDDDTVIPCAETGGRVRNSWARRLANNAGMIPARENTKGRENALSKLWHRTALRPHRRPHRQLCPVLPRQRPRDRRDARYTSLTVAPPKIGKSLLALAEAVDIATGRGILTGVTREPQRTFYYNAEDDADAIRLRVAAICAHYGIKQTELAGLAVVSGVMFPDLYLVSGEDGQTNENAFRYIEAEIERGGFDHVVFDPLQDMSRSPETNDVFRALGRRLREMATKLRVSVGIVHHTRKLAPGQGLTMDDQRGGGALRGTCRFNRLLVPMTEAEAAQAGRDAHRYLFRIGEVEANLAPPSSERNRWFRKISIRAAPTDCQ